ncbi:hypothetical protein H7097_00645 [Aeromicrobium sp.]|nr:hypothetical protein [Candidatus Saccharibacteria bacterium]
MASAKIKGLPAVVRDIHAGYGDADAVLFGSPPLPEYRRKKQSHGIEMNLRSQFVLVRSPSVTLTKIGEVDAL